MVVTILNKEDQDTIAECYYTKTSTELAKLYNVSPSSIHKIWRERGLRGKDNRRYYCNFDYFEKIDTVNKAYFLGFIAADGCVYRRKKGEKAQGLLSICINADDIEIIEKFKEDIGSNQPIIIGKQRGNIQPTATLAISSNKLVDDLARYGIIPRKTWVYTPEGVPENLIHHFIRGYFDGDGSVYKAVKSKNRDALCNYLACFVGNFSTMKFIQEVLAANGVHIPIKEDKRVYKGGRFYELKTCNVNATYNLLSYLYKSDTVFCLARKKKLADEFITLYNKKHKS